MRKECPVIYQVLPRHFGGGVPYGKLVPNGDIRQNGCGKMSRFTMAFLSDLKKAGVTHIWYTGLLEHATQTDYSHLGITPDHKAIVKGKAGSPYAVKDYYDIDPDLADHPKERMREFQNLLRRTHRAGLGLIMDFVPNHVARQYRSDNLPAEACQLGSGDDVSARFLASNNFYYIPGKEFRPWIDLKGPEDQPYREAPAKATGNDCFSESPGAGDWFETVKLNYGVDYQDGGSKHFDPIPDTWLKMRDILLFWADKGVDGFRCDMAEMVPVEFWAWVIPSVKKDHPEVLFIAEVYNPGLYRSFIREGGFDYLYDKVGLYDTLRKVITGMAPASDISSARWAVSDIDERMLEFLENHDEQRIASDFFAGNPLKAVPGMIAAACLTRSALMVYSGQELGERGMDEEGYSGRDGRTSIFDYWNPMTLSHLFKGRKYDPSQLSVQEKAVRSIYERIIPLKQEPAIKDGEMFDLAYVNKGKSNFDEHKQFAFLRRSPDQLILSVINFSDRPVQVGVTLPEHAFEHLCIQPTLQAAARDLMTNQKLAISFSHLQDSVLDIPAWSGRVLEIEL